MPPDVVGLLVTRVGGLPHQVGQGQRVPADPAGVAVRAVGPSAAAACEVAIPAPAPAAPPTATRAARVRNVRRSDFRQAS